MNDVKVIGAQEVIASLKEFKDSVRKKYTRAGLYAAAVVVRDEARSIVMVRTGALKKSIVARTDKDPQNPGEYAGYVTISKPKGGVFIQAGGKLMSAKAAFTAKAGARNKGQKYVKINPRRYAHLVEFGTRTAPAKPFLRPALESKREQAVEAFAASVKASLAKDFARKLNAKP